MTSPTAEPHRPPPAGPTSEITKGFVSLLLSAGLLTGLAFYFGWARYSAYLAYFNVPVKLMEYDSSEYVLASTTALFYPAGYALAVILISYFLRALIGRPYHPLTRAALVGAATAVVAAGILSLCGVVTIVDFPWEPPVLVAGVFVTLRVDRVGSVYQRWNRLYPVRWGVLGCVLLAGFWWISLYAQYRGHEAALVTAHNLDRLPKVTFTSNRALGLPGEMAHGDGSGTYFQEDKRYLLAHSGSTLAMLPLTWPRDGRAYVVRIDSDINSFSISHE